MNLTVDEITRSITGKSSLQDCNLEELKQVTTQYPFFGPARLLLAKKLYQENATLNNDQIQKASLYFQNPVWYQHLLNGSGFIDSWQGEEEVKVEEEVEEEVEVEEEEEVEAEAEEEEEVEGEVEEEVKVEEAEQALPLVLPDFKFEPVDTSTTELTFEPYHTVDYFASQGIKAREDEKNPDKFGKQLKSFTEWLKILKKVPASELGAALNPADEQKVEKLAEVSINDREVVTETMAEVWEKQGNLAKASEVYRKLSLLNPSKSSYFAAKIEQLKNL